MNKKGLAILMRARMRPNHPTKTNSSLSPLPNEANQMLSNSRGNQSDGHLMQQPLEGGKIIASQRHNASSYIERDFEFVRQSMHSAISMNKTEVLDVILNNFSEGYFSLSQENRWKLLLILAKEYDLNRGQVQELIRQYLGLSLPRDDPGLSTNHGECLLSAFYRIEKNMRHALKPPYEVLFERLNTHPGGLKFLSILRNDILSILLEENIASVRALDSYLKEKLSTWLSPAALELHQITWDDPASLLEKIVAYEAVHPISNLLDLKRRLGIGRRCFGYFHPAIPGEPLIFIEVALLKNVAKTIQEVLWDDPPIPECEASCALFYSISSTQNVLCASISDALQSGSFPDEEPGLAGINLGKFLIKRVITLVKRDMPYISTFATLSPIPGYMQWLLSKLSSQSKLAEVEDISHSSADRSNSTFWENILEPEEERKLMDLSLPSAAGRNGMEVMLNLLTSTNHEWTKSDTLLEVLKAPLMRLCARYILHEKKRGKALDSVANFHLQNGAMVERINWMADPSEKGLIQSGGIMVNYIYTTENIEEYAQSYFSTGQIHASCDLQSYVKPLNRHEAATD